MISEVYTNEGFDVRETGVVVDYYDSNYRITLTKMECFAFGARWLKASINNEVFESSDVDVCLDWLNENSPENLKIVESNCCDYN